jgi:hypothetical protein
MNSELVASAVNNAGITMNKPFLKSDDAGFIISQTIIADGGATSLISLMTDFRTESKARFGTGYVPGV